MLMDKKGWSRKEREKQVTEGGKSQPCTLYVCVFDQNIGF